MIFVHEQRHCCCPTAGKFAFFKGKVVGTPTPKVTWARANGEIHFQPNVCSQKYDEASQEHTIEVSVFCFYVFVFLVQQVGHIVNGNHCMIT